ncbi:MAG: NYN domain-containing protein [Chloroflexi bacterium]|nr:MAG: NYN domain-containing protein [Chloroflexota bacterium]
MFSGRIKQKLGSKTVGRDILVDGYNIIKNSAAFKNVEARNLAAARDALVTQLVNRYRHTPHRVLLVFDGDGASEQVSHDRRIHIIYSRHGETADNVIARLAAEARAAGREIETPSRDVARRARHRMAIRQKYGLDPNYDPDDEPEPRHATKRSKKKSSHRYR